MSDLMRFSAKCSLCDVVYRTCRKLKIECHRLKTDFA